MFTTRTGMSTRRDKMLMTILLLCCCVNSFSCCLTTAGHPKMSAENDTSEHPSVSLLRDYLRIKTVQPSPDYDACIKFLSNVAADLDLPYFVREYVPGMPILVMTWEGLNPDLPSILLNSHMDVVPVFQESWKYDAFAAVKEANGDIFGRGTQDMKSVGIQHIEAVRRLRKDGRRLNRTIHLSFMSDEEVGGFRGMGKFVPSPEFKALNVGLALDEGLASPDEVVPVYYGERSVYIAKFHCKGNPGHGSRFIDGTAAEKVHFLLNKLLDLREEQRAYLEKMDNLTIGDVTTVNLVAMSGGVAMNVVPNLLTIGFDMRITPTMDLGQFEKQAGGNIDVEILGRADNKAVSSVEASDPWFKAFKAATEKHNLTIDPRIFPAGSDSRFIRDVGIPAYGFSPINNSPVLFHDDNEFISESVFLKGIDIFYDVISGLANA